MILESVKTFGRRLRVLPELGPYEVHVGALTKAHVGKLVALTRKRATVVGRLDHVPMESLTKPLLIVQLGDYRTPLHPSEVVMVIPDSHKATVIVEPRKSAQETQQ